MQQGHEAHIHFVITSEGEILGDDTPANRDIVRRIRACVNACESLTTEDLERGIIGEMRAAIAQAAACLQAQSTTAVRIQADGLKAA